MELRDEDLRVYLFTPADGSASAAVKVVHRPTGTEVLAADKACQRENLRGAVAEMIAKINPNADRITAPKLVLFDDVAILLPTSSQDGRLTRQRWDFGTKRWQYFAKCPSPAATTWYDDADLSLIRPAGH